MFKSKSIAFLLIAAMLASMFAVFPAITVSADGPTVISNVQPAIPATVGSEITLSDYSVQLNNGTVLSPSEITWYNESNTAITRFTPSVAGVTKLTAKKTSDASVSKTIYVVAKNASDSEYVLYFTDFNSASDLDGWNKIVSTGDVYTVSNGKLTISGLNTNNPRIYLPSWLGDFGDYRIDVVGTQTNPTNSSRWFSVIYRAQNPATTGIPYYHMCVRNNATAGATSTTGGVELAYLYNNTWNYVKSSSYTEPINAAKNYTFSVLAKGSTIQYQINGDVVIHVDDVPTLGGDPATRRGGIGLQANSSKFVVDWVKVTLQLTTPVKPVPAPPKIINPRQPASNTLNHITNIGIVQSKAEYESYLNATANAPATLILYANGANLTTEGGTVVGTVTELMEKAENLPFIPAFYVKDQATIDQIAAAGKAVNLRDLLFISNDFNLVKYARDKYTLARGAVDFSAITGYTLTDEQILQIRGTVRKASSLIAILPDNLASQNIVRKLQALEITVWVMDKSLNGDTEAAMLIASGATGIITDKFAQIETAMQTLFEKNTLTKTPLIIGHRGNPTNAPENSISSYLIAIKNGADIIETDIQLTKDKKIVAMHDSTIDRTTTGTGAVSSLTLDEIKLVHLWADNATFERLYPDERVPTWEEILKAIKPTDAKIFCEIKTGDPSIIEPAVNLVKQYGMEDRVSFICFDSTQLTRLQQIWPTMTYGWLCNSPSPSTDMIEALNALDAQLNTLQAISSTFNPSYGNLSEYFVAAAVDRGISIWPWTYAIGSSSTFNKHFLMGIDGLTTDDAQYIKNSVKYISSDKNAIALSGNGASAQVVITSTTYGGAVTDITGSANTFYKIIEGSDIITVSGGKITAKAASGTASFMVGFKAKTPQNQEYILYTQPIKVTVGSDIGVRLTNTSKYAIDNYITGVKEATTRNTLLSNFQSSDKIVVLDKDGNVISNNTTLIGTGAKVHYVENGKVIDEKIIVVLGDVNGDAEIDSVDALLIKKAAIGNYTFSVLESAAGCFNDPTDPTPSSLDYLHIKRHIIGNYDLFSRFN